MKKIGIVAWILLLLAGCGSIGGSTAQTQRTATPEIKSSISPTPTSPNAIFISSQQHPTATSKPKPTQTTHTPVGETPTASVTPSMGSGTGSSPTSQESQIAQTVFQAINQSRAAQGLPALQWSPALGRSARQHNFAMVAAQQLSHQLPGEVDFGTREHQQGVQWSWAAENIGMTSQMDASGALGLHQSMMAEKPPDDGHRQNILSTSAQTLGIDIVLDTQHHTLWLTEDFAKPM